MKKYKIPLWANESDYLPELEFISSSIVALADRDFQQRAWIRQRGPEVYSPIEAILGFRDKYDWLKQLVRDQNISLSCQQLEAIMRLKVMWWRFDWILERDPSCPSGPGYILYKINHTYWEKIGFQAEKALSLIRIAGPTRDEGADSAEEGKVPLRKNESDYPFQLQSIVLSIFGIEERESRLRAWVQGRRPAIDWQVNALIRFERRYNRMKGLIRNGEVHLSREQIEAFVRLKIMWSGFYRMTKRDPNCPTTFPGNEIYRLYHPSWKKVGRQAEEALSLIRIVGPPRELGSAPALELSP